MEEVGKEEKQIAQVRIMMLALTVVMVMVMVMKTVMMVMMRRKRRLLFGIKVLFKIIMAIESCE